VVVVLQPGGPASGHCRRGLVSVARPPPRPALYWLFDIW